MILLGVVAFVCLIEVQLDGTAIVAYSYHTSDNPVCLGHSHVGACIFDIPKNVMVVPTQTSKMTERVEGGVRLYFHGTGPEFDTSPFGWVTASRSDANNNFARSGLLQVAIWTAVALIAWGVTRLRRWLSARRTTPPAL
jgi:hypothetical protein